MKKEFKNEYYVSEYIKCKNDFYYFCENYIMIEIPGGDTLFKLYKKQKDFIKCIEDNHYVITIKTRQTGISTTTQAYAAWLVLFHKNVSIGIISKDGREATRFARIIKEMILKLPDWLKPPKGPGGIGFRKATEQSFILTNGSLVSSATVDPKAPSKTLRGNPITLLIIDEAAFVDKLDDAWTSLVPTLSTSQKHARAAGVPYGTIVISTPNKTVGAGKWFFEKYSRAVSSEEDPQANSKFKPCVVYWKDIPELADDPNWYKDQCEFFDNDPRKIAQELELKFLSTTGTFFDGQTCDMLQECTKNISPKTVLKLFNGDIWVFDEAKPGRYYIMGIDSGSGYGTDNSTITIWDYETFDQVWEYMGKCEVTDFCKVIDYAASQYPGLIVPEGNPGSLGNQVAEHIDRSHYMQNLYKYKRGDKIWRGLITDGKTRPLMIDALFSAVSAYPQMVKSKRLALELIGLVTKTNGKVEADSGCKDDLAMSLAFCCFVRKYDPPLNIQLEKQGSDFLGRIISMNLGGDHDGMFGDLDEEEKKSASIEQLNAIAIRRIKNDDELLEKGGYINLLDFYQG
jgi:hypothetical protein